MNRRNRVSLGFVSVVALVFLLFVSIACNEGEEGPTGATSISSPTPKPPTATPSATPGPTPVVEPDLSFALPRTTTNESWLTPRYFFVDDRRIAAPFSVLAPDGAVMQADLRFEKILGTISVGELRIQFEYGPSGTFFTDVDREKEVWTEDVHGKSFEFWRTVDRANGFAPHVKALGVSAGEGSSQLDLRAEFETEEEFELILGIIRTIR